MQPKAGMTETPKRKTAPATDPVEAENGKITPEISLTETSTSKTGGEMVEEERLTASKTVNKGGRPPKAASTTAVTWSVRGVERETRAIIEKAAERAGKNLGQYLNDDVRGFAQSQISQAEAAGQAVASPKDLQVQVEQLTQLAGRRHCRPHERARPQGLLATGVW